MTTTYDPDVAAYPGLTPPGEQPRRYTPADNVTTTDVQAVSEGAVLDDDLTSIEFMGKRFRLAESIGLMPLLRFAHTAKQGVDTDDLEGLDAMYTLIRSCIDRTQVQAVDGDGKPVFDDTGAPVWDGPSQWDLFEAHAMDTQADGEDLTEMIGRAIQVISARPPKRRGGSSPSSPPTSGSSKGISSSPDTTRVPGGMVPVGDLGR